MPHAKGPDASMNPEVVTAEKKDPVCPGDESEQSPFYTHGLVFLLQFPALLYGQIYVPKSGNHPKTKKYKGQPRGCMKYPRVEPVTDA